MSVGQPAPADDHLVWQGPHSDRLLLDVAECWQYRDLLGIFVGRDLKVRYRQAVVGVLWVLVQPVVMLSVALFFYMQVGKQDQPPVTVGVPYAISGLCGLILYQLFMAGVRDGANSVVLARAMLTKIYFPRIFLPLTPVCCAAFDFLIACGLLLPLMIWHQVLPGPRLCLLPLIVLWAIVVTAAFAIGLSALNALYRDVSYAVPFFLQVGQFVSPTFYETASYGLEKSWWYGLNPMVAVIDAFRWSLIPHCPPPVMSHTIASAAVTLVLLVSSLRYFLTTEAVLADRL